jgi:DNA repair protein RecN (Recombination protein N)
VTLSLDVSRLPAVQGWLEEQALEADGECVVRRVITPDGRSRAFVNHSPVPLQVLRQLGEMLIDIHGQHA